MGQSPNSTYRSSTRNYNVYSPVPMTSSSAAFSRDEHDIQDVLITPKYDPLRPDLSPTPIKSSTIGTPCAQHAHFSPRAICSRIRTHRAKATLHSPTLTSAHVFLRIIVFFIPVNNSVYTSPTQYTTDFVRTQAHDSPHAAARALPCRNSRTLVASGRVRRVAAPTPQERLGVELVGEALLPLSVQHLLRGPVGSSTCGRRANAARHRARERGHAAHHSPAHAPHARHATAHSRGEAVQGSPLWPSRLC